MKSIKLKVVMWLIALFTVVGSTAQNPWVIDGEGNLVEDTGYFSTTVPWVDPAWEEQLEDSAPLKMEIFVESEPTQVYIEYEPLKNNEALQEMLELQLEETDSFNQNFKSLNQIIRDLPYVNVDAKLELLEHYNIDVNEINKKYTGLQIILLSLLSIYLLVGIAALDFKPHLYFTKKNRVRNVTSFILGGILLGYILPRLFFYINIDNFYLWQNLDKLF